MLKLASVWVAFGVLLAGPALAAADCSILKGKVIYEDTFADDSGGWSNDADATFGKPALKLTVREPNTTWVYVNNTFNATDGDYCVEAVLPSAPTADNIAYVGLAALYTDPNNFLLLMMSGNNDLALWRKSGGKWTKINDLSDPSNKVPPGSVVALRMTIKGGLITPWLNGNALKKVKVQVPDGDLSFGVYGQIDRPVSGTGAAFQFNKYRVTAAP